MPRISGRNILTLYFFASFIDYRANLNIKLYQRVNVRLNRPLTKGSLSDVNPMIPVYNLGEIELDILNVQMHSPIQPPAPGLPGTFRETPLARSASMLQMLSR